jgi:hypothetical protein
MVFDVDVAFRLELLADQFHWWSFYRQEAKGVAIKRERLHDEPLSPPPHRERNNQSWMGLGQLLLCMCKIVTLSVKKSYHASANIVYCKELNLFPCGNHVVASVASRGW